MAIRNLPVDREALLRAVTSRGETLLGTWLELADGTLHPLVDGDESVEGRAFEARMDANPDGFAKVPVYAREYRLMTAFVETVDDDALAASLDAALAGREAFRRFEAVLGAHPDEAARWRAFREAALVAWVLAWLRGIGVGVPWAPPAPDPLSTVDRPALVELLWAGGGVGPIVRPCPDRAAARDLFVRLCRDVSELVGEPFRKGDVRGRNRFVRAGVELAVDGASVVVSRVG